MATSTEDPRVLRRVVLREADIAASLALVMSAPGTRKTVELYVQLLFQTATSNATKRAAALGEDIPDAELTVHGRVGDAADDVDETLCTSGCIFCATERVRHRCGVMARFLAFTRERTGGLTANDCMDWFRENAHLARTLATNVERHHAGPPDTTRDQVVLPLSAVEAAAALGRVPGPSEAKATAPAAADSAYVPVHAAAPVPVPAQAAQAAGPASPGGSVAEVSVLTPVSLGTAGGGGASSPATSGVSFAGSPDSANGASPGEVVGMSPIVMGTPSVRGSAEAERTPSVIALERSAGGTGRKPLSVAPPPAHGTPRRIGRRGKPPAGGVPAASAFPASHVVAVRVPSGPGPFAVPIVDMAGRVLVEPANSLMMDALLHVLHDEVFLAWLCAQAQAVAGDGDLDSVVCLEIASSMRAFVGKTCSTVAVYSEARKTGSVRADVQLAFASMQDSLSALMNVITEMPPQESDAVAGKSYEILVGDIRVAAEAVAAANSDTAPTLSTVQRAANKLLMRAFFTRDGDGGLALEAIAQLKGLYSSVPEIYRPLESFVAGGTWTIGCGDIIARVVERVTGAARAAAAALGARTFDMTDYGLGACISVAPAHPSLNGAFLDERNGMPHVMQNDMTSCVSTALMSLLGVGFVNPLCERGSIRARVKRMIDWHRTAFGNGLNARATADAAWAAISPSFGVHRRQVDAMAVYDIAKGDVVAKDGMFVNPEHVWLGQLTPREITDASTMDGLMVAAFGERMRDALTISGGRLRILAICDGHAFGITRIDGHYVKDDPAASLLQLLPDGQEVLTFPRHSAMTLVAFPPTAQLKSIAELDEQHWQATGLHMPYVSHIGGKPSIVVGLGAEREQLRAGRPHKGKGYGEGAAAAAKAALGGGSPGGRVSPSVGAAPQRAAPAGPKVGGGAHVSHKGGTCRGCHLTDHVVSECWKCWRCKDDLFRCSRSGQEGCVRRKRSAKMHYSRIAAGRRPPPGYAESRRQHAGRVGRGDTRSLRATAAAAAPRRGSARAGDPSAVSSAAAARRVPSAATPAVAPTAAARVLVRAHGTAPSGAPAPAPAPVPQRRASGAALEPAPAPVPGAATHAVAAAQQRRASGAALAPTPAPVPGAATHAVAAAQQRRASGAAPAASGLAPAVEPAAAPVQQRRASGAAPAPSGVARTVAPRPSVARPPSAAASAASVAGVSGGPAAAAQAAAPHVPVPDGPAVHAQVSGQLVVPLLSAASPPSDVVAAVNTIARNSEAIAGQMTAALAASIESLREFIGEQIRSAMHGADDSAHDEPHHVQQYAQHYGPPPPPYALQNAPQYLPYGGYPYGGGAAAHYMYVGGAAPPGVYDVPRQ